MLYHKLWLMCSPGPTMSTCSSHLPLAASFTKQLLYYNKLVMKFTNLFSERERERGRTGQESEENRKNERYCNCIYHFQDHRNKTDTFIKRGCVFLEILFSPVFQNCFNCRESCRPGIHLPCGRPDLFQKEVSGLWY